MTEDREKLITAVIEQMKNDIEWGDYTAIAELLNTVPDANLKGYLSEGNQP
jgi:hypothetical protein